MIRSCRLPRELKLCAALFTAVIKRGLQNTSADASEPLQDLVAGDLLHKHSRRPGPHPPTSWPCVRLKQFQSEDLGKSQIGPCKNLRSHEGVHMAEHIRPRVKLVIGPDGVPLSAQDLPPASTKRWVIRRKAVVVAAVRGGLLTLEEACERYTLTIDELLSWQTALDRHGLAGLRTTKLQNYRH